MKLISLFTLLVTLNPSTPTNTTCFTGAEHNSIECCKLSCTTQNQTNCNSTSTQNKYKSESTNSTTCVLLDPHLTTCLRDVEPMSKFVLENGTLRSDSFNVELSRNSYVINKNGDVEFCKPKQWLNLAIVNVVGMFLSIVSLILSLIIAIRVQKWNKQTNLALLCHMTMLCLAYTVTLMKNLIPSDLKRIVCPLLPLLQQFFFLSAFFWTNVQAIVLHTAFGALDVPKRTKKTNCEVVRFGLVGWGLAFVVTGATFAAEMLETPVLRPTFVTYCWFRVDERGTAFLFYYGPMAVSLGVNVVVFCKVFVGVRKVARCVEGVNRNVGKQIYTMAVKLTVILGFCWITKMFVYGSGVVGNFWLYLDLLPAFQGVFILITFITSTKCNSFITKCKQKLKKQNPTTNS